MVPLLMTLTSDPDFKVTTFFEVEYRTKLLLHNRKLYLIYGMLTMFGDLDWPLNASRECQHQLSFLFFYRFELRLGTVVQNHMFVSYFHNHFNDDRQTAQVYTNISALLILYDHGAKQIYLLTYLLTKYTLVMWTQSHVSPPVTLNV